LLVAKAPIFDGLIKKDLLPKIGVFFNLTRDWLLIMVVLDNSWAEMLFAPKMVFVPKLSMDL
jgi:hypothetical protein